MAVYMSRYVLVPLGPLHKNTLLVKLALLDGDTERYSCIGAA